jgi:hypothetical protein
MKQPKGKPSEPNPLVLYGKVDVTGILATVTSWLVWRAGDVFIGPYDVECLIQDYLSTAQLAESILKPVTMDEAVAELSTIMERIVPLLPSMHRPDEGVFYFLPAIGMSRKQMAAFALMSPKEQLEIVIAVSEALLGAKPSDTSDGPREIEVDEAFWNGFIDGSPQQIKPLHGVRRVVFNGTIANFFWHFRLYRRFGGTEAILGELDVDRLVADDEDYPEEVLGRLLEEAIEEFHFGQRLIPMP